MNFITLNEKITRNNVIFAIALSMIFLLGFGIYTKQAKKTSNYHNPQYIYSAEEQKKINSETTSGSVEFIYTEQEQRDISKWTNKTMDNLVIDAENGDRAALYNLGEYFFLGLDFPIDVQRANGFFAESASLGFAPALDNISQMYINDESNPYLGLVYTNLTISFGHTEFIKMYHAARNEIIKNSAKGGQRMLNEIERIAGLKRAIILKNQKYIQDKKNITDEDYQYDHDYWLDIYNDDNEILDFSAIKEADKIYLEKLHRIYYQAITSDNIKFEPEIQAIKREMKNALYSTSEIEILTKQAKSQAKKNYKLVCKIKNDAKEAKKLLKTLDLYEDSI